jgi:nicotinate dehydrogenase subunit B
MTGLIPENHEKQASLPEKEFSRKSFLKGGGALVVGFSLAGAGLLPGKALAADSPFASNGPGDMYQVDAWIKIHADNTASIFTGAWEGGQGSSTALLQIAGEELDMAMSQLKFVDPDTNLTPDTGSSSGSSTIEQRGPETRAAAATARQALLGLASTSLGVPVASLTVKDGVVSGGGKTITYGDLLGDKLFNVRMPTSYKLDPGSPTVHVSGLSSLAPGVKPPAQYTLVGTSPPRLDIPAKVTGTFTYVNNIRVPGMLHGRVVRPRGQGAYGDGTNPAILSIDESSIRHIPNVRVLRKNNFLGVVAPHEYDAVQAAVQLKVKWADPPAISSSGNLWKSMRDFDSSGQAQAAIVGQKGNVNDALASAAKTVSGTYKYHYQDHGVIGPSCVVADVTPNGALIYSGTQYAYGVRSRLVQLLGLPANKIRVTTFEPGGAFGGHQGRMEVPLAAAVMSQLAGTPVRLQYMRWDEQGWGNFGPAGMFDIRGGVDAKGNIVGVDFTELGVSGFPTFPTEQQVGTPVGKTGVAGTTRRLPEFMGNGSQGNAAQLYAIPNYRLTVKTVPLINNYFKTDALRAVWDPQTFFALEQMIDELAHAINMDPLAFRVSNIPSATTGRWGRITNALQTISDYKPKVAASNLSKANVVTGRGVSLLPHVEALTGVVADIEVNKKTGKITATQIFAVQDVGLAINPAHLENQLIGNTVMTTSRALLEEIRFNTQRVTSLDWVSYPILRFKDHPKVTTALVQSIDQVSTGAGEGTTAATVGAIANAFFDATGVRIREAPMTPARVRATLKAAGVA